MLIVTRIRTEFGDVNAACQNRRYPKEQCKPGAFQSPMGIHVRGCFLSGVQASFEIDDGAELFRSVAIVGVRIRFGLRKNVELINLSATS
ncbi:MAG TPA: hypothetical protein VH370_10955 [Humisphaera sp.]|nr:hypothetical protein [Humisphaera sp.]